MQTLTATTLGLALTLSTLTGQEPRPTLPSDRSEGAASFDQSQVKGWLTTLTSEEFGGRGTGQNGFRLAAEMIAKHFKDLGLIPAQEVDGDANPYFQVVPWTQQAPDPEQTRLVIMRDGKPLFSRSIKDGLHGKASSSSSVTGDLVIVFADPADGSELEALDLTDKLVLIASRSGFGSERKGWQGRRDMTRTANKCRSVVRKAGGKIVGYLDDALYALHGPMLPRTQPEKSASRTAAARGRAPTAFSLPSSALKEILAAADIKAKDGAVLIELPGITAKAEVKISSTQAPAYNVVANL